MYCHYCGKKIAKGVRACPYCGTANQLNPKNAQKTAPYGSRDPEKGQGRSGRHTRKQTGKGRLMYVCIPLGLFLVCLALFLNLRLFGKTSDRTGAEAGRPGQLRAVLGSEGEVIRTRAAQKEIQTTAEAVPVAAEEGSPAAAVSAPEQTKETQTEETEGTGTDGQEKEASADKAPETASSAGHQPEETPAEEPSGSVPAAEKSLVLAVKGISASSVREYDVQYYDARYVLDGDPATAWSEGRGGYGPGEYLELQIPAGVVVTGGEVLPGFYKSEDLFYRNGAPTNLIVSSGGQSCRADITAWAGTWRGYGSKCCFTLARSVISDGTVRVEIGDYRPGTQYDDTMISELRLTGYASDGTAPETMQAIETGAEAPAGSGNDEPEGTEKDNPAAQADSAYQNGTTAIRQDVRTDALMTYGALSAKYGAEAQMVHGLHWALPVNGLTYEIEFMAGGFSEDGMPFVAPGDPVWHVGGPLRILLEGTDGSYTAEELADRLRSTYSDVSQTVENGAGTGYYLSDRYAVITFADSEGRYWVLEIDQAGGDSLTGDSYAWLGLL